jgi:hypothetical protein
MPSAKQFDLARNFGLEPTVFLGGHIEAQEVCWLGLFFFFFFFYWLLAKSLSFVCQREPQRFDETVEKCLRDGAAFCKTLASPVELSALQRRVLFMVWKPDASETACQHCHKE